MTWYNRDYQGKISHGTDRQIGYMIHESCDIAIYSHVSGHVLFVGPRIIPALTILSKREHIWEYNPIKPNPVQTGK